MTIRPWAIFLLLPGALMAQTRYVSPSGSDAGPNPCTNPLAPCLTIQHAHNQAALGDSISMAAGTYSESPRVAKSVSLVGAGPSLTWIAPNAANQLPNPISGTGTRILAVDGSISVTLRDFTVEFPPNQFPPTSTSPIDGILLVRGANATIDNVRVFEIHDASVSGVQTGNCIRAGAFVSSVSYPAGNVIVRNSEVRFCQKTGLVCNEAGSNCLFENNLVQDGGLGQQNAPNPPRTSTLLAPNGIRIGFGAVRVVRNNTVRRFQCELPSPTCGGDLDNDLYNAGGILLYEPGAGSMVENNFVTASDSGFAAYNATSPSPLVVVTGNSFVNNRFRDVFGFAGTQQWRSNLLDGSVDGLIAVADGENRPATVQLNPASLASEANTIRNATRNGIWLRDLCPTCLRGPDGAPRPLAPAGSDTGTRFSGSSSGSPNAPQSPFLPLVTGSLNRFVNNLVAGLDHQPDEGDANLPCNWWGSALGPGAGGANPALTSAGDVVAPWALNDTNFACSVIGPQIVLGASKTGPATVLPGSSFTWTLAVTNLGPADRAGTVVSDPVPSGVSSMSWTCSASGGALCPAAAGSGAILQTLTSFPVGGMVTYLITATLAAGVTGASNVATATPPSLPGAVAVTVSHTVTVPPPAIPALERGGLAFLALALAALAVWRLSAGRS